MALTHLDDFARNVGKENAYGYNDKELDTDFGFNLLFYGARLHDPALGRFTGVDPISDKFPHVSTYNYAENEPIANIDLHGLQKLRATNLRAYKAEKEKFNSYPEVKPSTTRSRMWKDLLYGYEVKVGTANNLRELIGESIMGTDIVYLTGDAAQAIRTDPELESFRAELENRFSSHEEFGNGALFDSGQEVLGFGGTRGDFLNMDDFDQNSEVASNELTWMLRNATVKWWAESDKDGNFNVSFHINDRLDLTPSSNRSAGYNIISVILGAMYHKGVTDGNMELQTRAEIDINSENN